MNTTKTIVTLPGDGIGPEVTAVALDILRQACAHYGVSLSIKEHPFGGASLEAHGKPLTDATIAACQTADAILLGAVGDPQWDDQPSDNTPEAGLLGIREALGLYANLRPIRVYEPLIDASSLKPEIVRQVNILIVRELTGGIYFGEPRYTKTDDSGTYAVDTMRYHEDEIKRISKVAFEAARKRNGAVCLVDKANVLDTSRLWRTTVATLAEAYPDITQTHMLVDNCAMQLVRDPSQFDVIVTSNMFGDILSDEASMITGSIGMLPSASLGAHNALFEPVHGSAPDIAGEGKANPIAAIASAAMLCRHAFDMDNAAADIEGAISDTLAAGYRTGDIYRERKGETRCDTSGMGAAISDHLQHRHSPAAEEA